MTHRRTREADGYPLKAEYSKTTSASSYSADAGDTSSLEGGEETIPVDAIREDPSKKTN